MWSSKAKIKRAEVKVLGVGNIEGLQYDKSILLEGGTTMEPLKVSLPEGARPCCILEVLIIAEDKGAEGKIYRVNPQLLEEGETAFFQIKPYY